MRLFLLIAIGTFATVLIAIWSLRTYLTDPPNSAFETILQPFDSDSISRLKIEPMPLGAIETQPKTLPEASGRASSETVPENSVTPPASAPLLTPASGIGSWKSAPGRWSGKKPGVLSADMGHWRARPGQWRRSGGETDTLRRQADIQRSGPRFTPDAGPKNLIDPVVGNGFSKGFALSTQDIGVLVISSLLKHPSAHRLLSYVDSWSVQLEGDELVFAGKISSSVISELNSRLGGRTGSSALVSAAILMLGESLSGRVSVRPRLRGRSLVLSAADAQIEVGGSYFTSQEIDARLGLSLSRFSLSVELPLRDGEYTQQPHHIEFAGDEIRVLFTP